MKQCFTLLLITILLSSCYTSKSLASRIQENPMVLTPSALTGLYENRIEGDDQNSLWNDLCLHNKDKKQNIAEGNQVFLSYIEGNEITAELYQDDFLIDKMTLTGRPKDKFFTIRKGSHFFTLIFLTSIQSKKTILGNDANADLLIAQGHSHTTMLMEDEAIDDAEVVTAVYLRRSDQRPDRKILK
ncbi:hypothetical protein BST92_00655 [Nonlabens arenilitoris]|uniref:Uncharacterized protein n=1 Tax=Nonlabens arenilitoris TaxID=1217969 RepID=A0A2S7UFN7_9FLAO|nr:hypothetical protein [Nonlabens arenilitoris]PQJ33103.1 hypothetical protein BST92_00655 [Nonlabens arenilitoris]